MWLLRPQQMGKGRISQKVHPDGCSRFRAFGQKLRVRLDYFKRSLMTDLEQAILRTHVQVFIYNLGGRF